jgi:hypothetical protein
MRPTHHGEDIMKLIAASLLIAAGCAADEPTSAPLDPQLDVRLTATPSDFDSVRVDIAMVDLGAADGTTISLGGSEHTFDLMSLQQGTSALLGSATLSPGTYDHLFLFVDSAIVTVGGESYATEMAQHDIMIDLAATLEANMKYELTLTFDPAQSVMWTDQGYSMTPVIDVSGFDATSAP